MSYIEQHTRVRLVADAGAVYMGYMVHSCRSPYSDSYKAAMVAAAGQEFDSPAHFIAEGSGLPTSYNLQIGDKLYGVTALLIDTVDGVDPWKRGAS